MAKVTARHSKSLMVNLLPPEILAAEAHTSRLTKVKRLCIGAIVFVTAITIAVSILRLTQYQQVQRIEKELEDIKAEVVSLKGKEELLFSLKQRLATIKQLSGSSTAIENAFRLVLGLTPSGVKLTLIDINEGRISLNAESSSLELVDNFFRNLLSPQKNEGKISKIQIDGFSRSSDGKYKYSVNIVTK